MTSSCSTSPPFKVRPRPQRTWEGLTPSHGAELQDVSADVGVEDLDQSYVHVDGLQPHPGEGGQQEVVQEDGGGRAQAGAVHHAGQPAVQQEDHVEAQQGRAEVHQDLGRVVSPQFSGTRSFTSVSDTRFSPFQTRAELQTKTERNLRPTQDG